MVKRLKFYQPLKMKFNIWHINPDLDPIPDWQPLTDREPVVEMDFKIDLNKVESLIAGLNKVDLFNQNSSDHPGRQ